MAIRLNARQATSPPQFTISRSWLSTSRASLLLGDCWVNARQPLCWRPHSPNSFAPDAAARQIMLDLPNWRHCVALACLESELSARLTGRCRQD